MMARGRVLGLGLLPLLAVSSVVPLVTTVEIRMQQKRLDYFFPAPTRRSVVFKIHARDAPEKSRIMFTSPLPAGRHRYEVQVLDGKRDRILVIATPVSAGKSTFEVNIAGEGRFDFGFWTTGPDAREYRFSVEGPLKNKTFDLDMPERTLP